jgi:hypothetical protein
VPNITWTYHGDTIAGQAALGNFSVLSSFPNSMFGDFASRDHLAINDHSVSNITTTDVPDPRVGVSPKTPEPTSFLLLGLGLPLIGVWRWLKARAA